MNWQTWTQSHRHTNKGHRRQVKLSWTSISEGFFLGGGQMGRGGEAERTLDTQLMVNPQLYTVIYCRAFRLNCLWSASKCQINYYLNERKRIQFTCFMIIASISWYEKAKQFEMIWAPAPFLSVQFSFIHSFLTSARVNVSENKDMQQHCNITHYLHFCRHKHEINTNRNCILKGFFFFYFLRLPQSANQVLAFMLWYTFPD